MQLYAISLLALVMTAVGAGASQLPLGKHNAFSVYDVDLFTPLGDLSALSTTEFTTLNHPAFPQYNVRVKQSHFCDGTVRSVSSRASL